MDTNTMQTRKKINQIYLNFLQKFRWAKFQYKLLMKMKMNEFLLIVCTNKKRIEVDLFYCDLIYSHNKYIIEGTYWPV